MKHVRSLAGGVGMGTRGALLAGFVLLVAVASGCGKPAAMRSDAGDASADGDARPDTEVGTGDMRVDAVDAEVGPTGASWAPGRRPTTASPARAVGTAPAGSASRACAANTACTQGCNNVLRAGDGGSWVRRHRDGR